MLESLVQVAHLPEFFFDPARFDFLLELAQHRRRRIVFLQRFKGRLRGEHPALDRQMNSLEPRRIQEAGRVAEDHPSIARDRRNRPPAAVRHRLRAVADHLAALEQLRHKRMPLELLQHALRIEPRIGVVESRHEAERDDIVFRAINPRAAVFFRGERPAHRVNHFARSDAARGHFPQFFHADAVGLRIGVFRKIEFRDELLGQRSARAFGENHDFGLQIVSRLEVRFLMSFFVDALVVGAHAGDAIAVEEQFRAGESGEDGDAGLFDLARPATSQTCSAR